MILSVYNMFLSIIHFLSFCFSNVIFILKIWLIIPYPWHIELEHADIRKSWHACNGNLQDNLSYSIPTETCLQNKFNSLKLESIRSPIVTTSSIATTLGHLTKKLPNILKDDLYASGSVFNEFNFWGYNLLITLNLGSIVSSVL